MITVYIFHQFLPELGLPHRAAGKAIVQAASPSEHY